MGTGRHRKPSVIPVPWLEELAAELKANGQFADAMLIYDLIRMYGKEMEEWEKN